ncbi:MAG: hemolysin family protein [Canibacter sp.]
MNIGLVIVFIAIAIIMLAFGGVLAATEAALSVRSRAELFRLADGDRRSDRAIRAIAEDEAAHTNAIGFARVIAESLVAVLITVVLAYTLERLSLTLLLAVVILTASTFVLVGASPRSVGVNHADTFIRLSAPLVRAVRFILGPIATGLIRFSNRVSGKARETRDEDSDERQILSMVDRAAERNLLEEGDRAYIHSLVEFGDTIAREVMVPRTDMMTVDADITVREALEELLASRHSRMPVVAEDADDIHGMVYLRDLAGFVNRHENEADTASVTRMMRPAMFVPDLIRAGELLQQMRREANHLALTVDEYGGISGLVTLEDLIEELVGEIYDEHDRERPEVEQQEDGSFLLNPRVSVNELGQLFDIEIEDDDVDTVAGLLVKELGRLADTNDCVTIAGIELTAFVTDRRHTIHAVRAQWVGGVRETREHDPVDSDTRKNHDNAESVDTEESTSTSEAPEST